MKDYIRKVHYHETDKMGITHHSNYLKWMEEARIDFLEQLGFGYGKLEGAGIISPVTAAQCQYKRATIFGDAIRVRVAVEAFKGVRLVIQYTMTDAATGELVLVGRTEHCFVSREGRPIILKKQFPAFDAALRALACGE